EVKLAIWREKRLQAFIDEFATIDLEAAKRDLESQVFADEKANKYVLGTQDAKVGQEHVKPYMDVCMTYDAQGTQLGDGKAYLNKGQEPARKDITIVFM
ncbi:hypothetical protein, partial [Gordonibacter sp.]